MMVTVTIIMGVRTRVMMKNNDIRTVGYVLRRTNYGEADRILNLITPVGKNAVIARGVRKMKSKLAGGIEPFTRSDFQIHQGRGELGILTSAKMQKYYSRIVQNLERMELAAKILKRVDAVAENTNSEEYFMLVDQSLAAIDAGENLELVEAWFLLNLKRIMGEEVNLYRDVNGEKLEVDEKYNWDSYERAMRPDTRGRFGVNEIKMLRLMASNDLNIVRKIKYGPQVLEPISELVREL